MASLLEYLTPYWPTREPDLIFYVTRSPRFGMEGKKKHLEITLYGGTRENTFSSIKASFPNMRD